MKGIHIEREIVELTIVISNRTVGIAIKGDDVVDKIPNLSIVGMEDMCAIGMDIDSFYLFTIEVSAQMRSLINNETGFSGLLRAIGKCSTVQSCSYNDIVVMGKHVYLQI
jgi:hypothetical protein